LYEKSKNKSKKQIYKLNYLVDGPHLRDKRYNVFVLSLSLKTYRVTSFDSDLSKKITYGTSRAQDHLFTIDVRLNALPRNEVNTYRIPHLGSVAATDTAWREKFSRGSQVEVAISDIALGDLYIDEFLRG
jgi:hypothetical protein